MTLDQGVALFSAAVSFSGLIFVGIQMRGSTDQRKVESLLEIYRCNREILSLGFGHPELFKVLHGKTADPIVERHYLQLWFNQFALIHSFSQRKFITSEMKESLEQGKRHR